MKILFFIIFSSSILISQPWMEGLTEQQKSNFFEIQKSFNEYEKTIDIYKKGTGYKQYKRWEWFWKDRVLEDGSFPNFNQTIGIIDNPSFNKSTTKQSTIEWESIGPNSSPGGYAGMGRANCAVNKPGSPNEIWAGSASGGIWKTTNNGADWEPITDFVSAFQVLGVSDIAFDPDDTDIIYIASGDRDAADTYSNGILKSTDGGSTWQASGLSYDVTSTRRQVNKIIIHPNNTAVLYVACSDGVYKSTNSGDNWNKIRNGNFKDLEMHPTVTEILYASGANSAIHRTTNDGVTWTSLSSGLPSSDIQRIAIAVSPDQPDWIYAIYSRGNSGLKGVYKSTNSGDDWTQVADHEPNMLNWAINSNATGGQGWYDLCIAVSPDDADVVLIGGVNTWRTTNGGTDWEIVSMWYGGTGIDPVHADQHDLWYNPANNKLLVSNDGGVYTSTNDGEDFSWIGSGKIITQFYEISASETIDEFVIGGSQDNGTKLLSEGEWSDVLGGDGMQCHIYKANPNLVYGSSQNGNIYKSTNGGNNFRKINAVNNSSTYIDIDETGAWVTPYEIDPEDPDIMYVGMDNMWKSTDGGDRFSKISVNASGKFQHIEIAESDTDYLYAATDTQFWRSTDAGNSWTQGTRPGNRNISHLEINPNNELEVWATNSSWNASSKVFHSTDGGSNWTNISSGIPNLPVNCVFYEKDNNNRIYIGTDIGIYYRDDNNTSWTTLNAGLPNVDVRDIDKSYTHKKLYAGTYGRGLWKYDLGEPIVIPTLITPANESTEIPTSISLEWSDSQDYTYDIQIASDVDFNFMFGDLEGINNSEVMITDLDNFTEYFWRVRANFGAQQSDWSEVFNFRTQLARPEMTSPPNNAFGVSTTITLDWEGNPSANSYDIEVSTLDDFSNNFIDENVSESSYTAEGLDNFTEYFWRVKANLNSESSEWSVISSFTTIISDPIQTAPEEFSTDLISSVNFQWDEVFGADRYSLQIGLDEEFSNIFYENSQIDINEYTTTLELNRNYYWRVKAHSQETESNWSQAQMITTLIPPASLVQPEKTTFGNENDIDFSWSEPNNFIKYFFQLSETITFEELLIDQDDLVEAVFEMNELEFGGKYYWRVRYESDAGLSPWSEIFDFSVKLNTPVLVNPVNDLFNADLDGSLEWQAVANSSKYHVQISGSEDFSTDIVVDDSTETESYNYADLEKSTKYYWRIKALDSPNFSDWSEVRSFTTPITSPVLLEPSNESELETTSVNLAWQELQNANYYQVQISNTNDFSALLDDANNIENNQYLFEGLQEDISYFWRLRANLNGNFTEWSLPWSFTYKKEVQVVIETPILISPANNSTNQEFSNIDIVWENQENANSYNVNVSDENNFENQVLLNRENHTDNTLELSNLLPNKTYYWRVQANGESESSDWSEVWNFSTKNINSVYDDHLGKFLVYPNPVDDILNISTGNVLNGSYDLQIFNVNGDLVKSYKHNAQGSKIISIKTYDLSTGAYLLILEHSKGRVNIKFNKN